MQFLDQGRSRLPQPNVLSFSAGCRGYPGRLTTSMINIASLIYRLSLPHPTRTHFLRKLERLCATLARRAVIRWGDPTCTMSVHGQKLRMPLSHQLPMYVAVHPLYDALLQRVCAYLRHRKGSVVGIDVGANIGDTILACRGTEGDRFLGIEANPRFFHFLQDNLGRQQGVRLLHILCCSKQGIVKVEIRESRGTASIHEATTGTTVPAATLDDVVERNPEFKDFNFLKIDTDGYDFEVLGSAQRSIKANQPAILFECDASLTQEFVKQFSTAQQMLIDACYSTALLYDNLGHLFGEFNLADLPAWRQALSYHLISGRCYYDILVMRPEYLSEFRRLEADFFGDRISDPKLRETAKALLTPT